VAPQNAISKWPGSISYVPQNTVILNGTIEDNILMGYKKFSGSDYFVENAIQISQLSDLINQLPNGKETQVGEKGTKLSGGQRQRIGIARALLSQPKVLVLDEATSSLDGVTESRINSSIQSLKGSVTVIVVAHRLVTVKNADLVVYMSNGQIEAFGTFQEVRNKVPDFDEQAKLMNI
jgi:ABC-type multidrug transport system fused ATPase/permease subunit